VTETVILCLILAGVVVSPIAAIVALEVLDLIRDWKNIPGGGS
jgi:hypothetical protein